jgi:pimeloyl-ACP methyl ester carboxylesterase
MMKMESKNFVIKNKEDKRIQGMVRLSEDMPKGTVVLLHGLGGWKEQPLLVIIADELCRSGYNVVTFDAADGAKGPDADFAHSTTNTYVEDLENVVAFAEKARWFSGPLILIGHSLGGLTVLHYTRLHPGKVTKLVTLAQVVSWKKADVLTLLGGLWWLARNKNKTPGPDREKLPLDRAWLLDLMKFDAMHDAPYISIPTLIISASRDRGVVSPKAHYALGQRFPNALCVIIPGAGHVFWKHEKQVADTITKWLTSS